MLIDSYTHILSDYHNVFLWRKSWRQGRVGGGGVGKGFGGRLCGGGGGGAVKKHAGSK